MLERIASAFWGPFTLLILLGLGGYLTLQTRFFSIRCLPEALRQMCRGKTQKGVGRPSAWMAMSTALGATMGTGNIVGVATAMVAGGPGAVLWMQIAALAGMMIKFSEVALAVEYRRLGPGPMGYLKLVSPSGKAKTLPDAFAVCCLTSAVGMGNMTQSNAASQALSSLSVPPVCCAVFFGIFTFMATGRGVGGVMRLSSWIVPVITVGYLALAGAAVWQERAALPLALRTVGEGAFGLRAAAGGAAGYGVRSAVRYGLSRGIFSNEAGMGSSPIAHAEADGKGPVEQGMWGILEVLIDTSLSCTLTALVLLTAGGGVFWQESGLDGAALATACFSTALDSRCGPVVSLFIALFGITSVCGWYAYGRRALEFLCPHCRTVMGVYRLLYAVGAALGAVWGSREIWLLCDFFTGTMLLLNLPGLIVLAPRVCRMVRTWEERRHRR